MASGTQAHEEKPPETPGQPEMEEGNSLAVQMALLWENSRWILWQCTPGMAAFGSGSRMVSGV